MTNHQLGRLFLVAAALFFVLALWLKNPGMAFLAFVAGVLSHQLMSGQGM